MVDIDDTIKATCGYQKQGTGCGYAGVKGLNALIETVTIKETASITAGARLRKGGTIPARDASKFGADLLATVARLCAAAAAATRAEAKVSLTVRMDPHVKKTIASIGEDAWTKME